MSELLRIRLEAANKTWTGTPSRVANIQDTMQRHHELFAGIAERIATLRRQVASTPITALTTAKATIISPVTAVSGTQAAPVTTSQPAGALIPVVTAATNFVSLVETVKARPFAGLKSALDAKLPEAAIIAARLTQDLQSGEVSRLEARGGEINAVLARATAIVREAHELQAAREIESTVHALTSSLSDLGYKRIRTIDDRGARVLKARNGLTAVVARLDAPNGDFTIDAAGFQGRDCEAAVSALIGRLADYGLLVRTRETVFHGRADGGELVRSTSALFDPLLPEPQTQKRISEPAGLSPARKAARRLAARRS
jgi:hypothetical protein